MNANSPVAAPAMQTPTLSLSRIGQIAIVVKDVERSTAFYRDTLGMRFLFAFPGLAFHRDGPPVPVGQQLDHGQTKARSLELAGKTRIHLAEGLEQVTQRFG